MIKKPITTMNEVCEMCAEYDEQRECWNKVDCRLIALLRENISLRKTLGNTMAELQKTKEKMSWMIDPNVIGDQNDMGW